MTVVGTAEGETSSICPRSEPLGSVGRARLSLLCVSVQLSVVFVVAICLPWALLRAGMLWVAAAAAAGIRRPARTAHGRGVCTILS